MAPGLIVAGVDTVALETGGLSTDALDLEAAAQDSGQEARGRCLALYSGAFLDDLDIETEEGFSDWRGAERARLEGLATAAGTALMRDWEAVPGGADPELAHPELADPELAERLLSIDPYNEPAMRVRMRLLAQDGRPAAAIEAAEGFAARLGGDLGIEPSAEFAELAGRIRGGGLAPAAAPAARSAIEPAAQPASHRAATVSPEGRRGRFAAPAMAVGALVALVAAVLWGLLARDRPPDADAIRLLVRPFEAEAGVPRDLARGFSDDLSTELVRRSTLDVLSRQSGRLIPEDADAESGASHVLRGRLRADAGAWTLHLWITETAGGREIWAERFEGSAEDTRGLRNEIVVRLSDRIGVALRPPPGAPAIQLPEPAMPAYLRALADLHSGRPDANAEAIAAMEALARAHPGAVEPVAGLVLAFERVAFEADDYARAAGLHWLEGYLLLKRQLAGTKAAHPGLLAARARLALRRLDYPAAEALSLQALAIDGSHVAALDVLAQSLALSGDPEGARKTAILAITLSPAAPVGGYTALALAAFADGHMTEASAAAAAALDVAESPPLQLLALAAAAAGLGQDAGAARAAFGDLVTAVENRPFGAWRLGEVTFTNPRAATWRRPSGAAAAHLIRFDDPSHDAALRKGLAVAAGSRDAPPPARAARLSGPEIEDLLIGRAVAGLPTWLVHQSWTQVRAPGGALFQEGAFGPLPAAREGRSRVVDGRLCDRWVWEGVELESCQIVVRTEIDGVHALIGETGRFPFVLAETEPDAPDTGAEPQAGPVSGAVAGVVMEPDTDAAPAAQD